jgi:hypothetical protein
MAKLDGAFNPETFLSTSGPGRQRMSFGKGQTVFAEGAKADALIVSSRARYDLAPRPTGKRKRFSTY